jgi:hypothetical protein
MHVALQYQALPRHAHSVVMHGAPSHASLHDVAAQPSGAGSMQPSALQTFAQHVGSSAVHPSAHAAPR